MGKKSRRRRHSQPCGEHPDTQELLDDPRFLCLACGKPMPRPGTRDFNPTNVVMVVEVLADGTRQAIDAVHVGCAGAVLGADLSVEPWGPMFN